MTRNHAGSVKDARILPVTEKAITQLRQIQVA
jgi:hypothetical protein